MSRWMRIQHLFLVCAAFFLCGHSITLNDTLIPYLQSELSLGYAQIMLIQMSFFSGYLLASPTAGLCVCRVGYLRGIGLSLVLAGLGALGVAYALIAGVWIGVLYACLVMGAGVGALQVACNPYALELGKPEGASGRLSFAQGFTCVGMVLAPLLAAWFVRPLPRLETYYLIVGGSWIALAAASFCLTQGTSKSRSVGHDAMPLRSVLREFVADRGLVLCACGLFLYVGAEISVGSFLIAYLQEPEIGGMDLKSAAQWSALYWMGLMLGRFLEPPLILRHGAARMVMWHSIAAIGLMLIVVVSVGYIAVAAVLLMGLANSVMFPALFALGMQHIGNRGPLFAGILCTAQVGGALVPVAQGVLADTFGLKVAFLLPTMCYCAIFALTRLGIGEKADSTTAELAV